MSLPLAFLRRPNASWFSRRPGPRHGLLLTVLVGFAVNHAIWTHAHELRQERLMRELNSRIALENRSEVAAADYLAEKRNARP